MVTWAPLSHFTNLKAPFTTLGAVLKSAVLIALAERLPRTCLGRMPYWPWLARNGANTWVIVKTTVWGSGVSIDLMYFERSPRRGDATSLYASSCASA